MVELGHDVEEATPEVDGFLQFASTALLAANLALKVTQQEEETGQPLGREILNNPGSYKARSINRWGSLRKASQSITCRVESWDGSMKITISFYHQPK